MDLDYKAAYAALEAEQERRAFLSDPDLNRDADMATYLIEQPTTTTLVVTDKPHRVGKGFVTAGNATFTVESPKSGHRTYKVTRKEAKGGMPEMFFVALLTGSNNETDYTYVGKLNKFTGQVEPTKASTWTTAQTPAHVLLLNRILARVWCDDHQAFEQHGYRVYHVGKCGRCGRPLTVPASIKSGIGPECAKHVQAWSAK
jgi:hypothetical protein